MTREEAIHNIEAEGEGLFKDIKAIDEGTKLTKEQIKKTRNKLIDFELEKCLKYKEVLTKEEIRKHLIIGLQRAIENNREAIEEITGEKLEIEL